MNRIAKKIRRFLINNARSLVLKANYYLGNYKEVVWLIGDARSGTTWVSSLINYKKDFREMFEPFHHLHVKGMDCVAPYRYIRPYVPKDSIQKIAHGVFTGSLTNPRVDGGNRQILYKALLIKDIYANLFAYWAVQHFPKIKIVLLIRNPFAVAVSKYRKRNWQWPDNPLDLLNQFDLFQDHLHPFENLIRTTSNSNDYIQIQILIWCILNYIPLLQFRPDQVHIAFYENIYADPEYEILKIINYIYPDNEKRQISIPEKVIKLPSRVTHKDSHIFSITSGIDFWKNELDKHQIHSGYNILAHFGFDNLYRNDSMGNMELIEKLLKQTHKLQISTTKNKYLRPPYSKTNYTKTIQS
jgi:hypothetical protein